MLSINNLLRKPDNDKAHVGKAVWGNIDKTGYFYHVVTKSWNGDRIFNKEIADYRHNLLCKLCGDAGITILFSVTMPNHTHEVFMVPSWEALAQVIRLLNSRVSIQIRRVFGNREYLRAENQFVPNSCFWMFEKNYFVFPYDEKIFSELFGMRGDELYLLYSQKSAEEVRAFAQSKFIKWTREMIEAVFYKK